MAVAGTQVTYGKYAGQEKIARKRVYYSGSDQLYTGYALCYDRDDAAATNKAGTTLTAAYSSWHRVSVVEKPASGNLHNYAGVVSKESGGVTGPAWVYIDLPNGGVQNVYGDGNWTAMTSYVTVQAASYNHGQLGDGVVVGRAIQTKNRSTTAGTVQAIITGADPIEDQIYGAAVPSSTNNVRSYSIWESCPFKDLNNIPPELGYGFFDDFVKVGQMADAVSTDGYYAVLDTGVTIGGDEDVDAVGGILQVANNDADNDFGHISVGGATGVASINSIIAAASHKPFWFEGRVKAESITAEAVGWFLGMGEAALMVDAGLTADTAVVADENYIGFTVICESTDTCTPVFHADGQTADAGTAVTLVADTWVNLGMVGNGTTITQYVNNVSKHAITAAEIAGATFPSAEYMTQMLLTQNGTAAEKFIKMDWWGFAQLR